MCVCVSVYPQMLLSAPDLRHDLGDLHTPAEEGGCFALQRLAEITEGE